MEIGTTLYRYEQTKVYNRGVILILRTYKVIKTTPCGVWVKPMDCVNFTWVKKRFMRLNAIRKFACETEEEALESFIARRQRQIAILKIKLEDAETALFKAKEMKQRKQK